MSDYKIGSIVSLTENSKETRFVHALKSLNDLTAERDQLRAELAAAKERGDGLYLGLRQTLEALGGVAQPGVSEAFLILGVPGEAAAIKRLNTALAAHAERLVAALNRAYEGAARQLAEPRHHGNDQYALTDIASTCELAIAATPTQSLAAHDAALLREVADGVNKIAVVGAIDTPQSIRDLIADAIRAKADRTEKAAPEVYDVWKEAPNA